MQNKLLIALGAVTLSFAGYSVVAGTIAPATPSAVATTAPSTQAAGVDVGNTKCIVMSDDDASDKTVAYQGKLYHVCCPQCVKAFNKDPEKYVKALDANPAAYGVKAAK